MDATQYAEKYPPGMREPYGAALAAAESVILPKKEKEPPRRVAPHKVLVRQSAFAVASWALRYPAQNTSAMKV